VNAVQFDDVHAPVGQQQERQAAEPFRVGLVRPDMVATDAEQLGVRGLDPIVYLPKGGQLMRSAGREIEHIEE
jgi:hypothetical protein